MVMRFFLWWVNVLSDRRRWKLITTDLRGNRRQDPQRSFLVEWCCRRCGEINFQVKRVQSLIQRKETFAWFTFWNFIFDLHISERYITFLHIYINLGMTRNICGKGRAINPCYWILRCRKFKVNLNHGLPLVYRYSFLY